MEKLAMKKLTEEQVKLLRAYTLINSNSTLKDLAEKLDLQYKSMICKEMHEKVNKAEDEISNILNTIPQNEEECLSPKEGKKPVRIYMDGVFDIIHSGHFNAIRQARKLGDVLVVGINSDKEVLAAKGPTLLNEKERAMLVRACKWVDEVVEDTPYTPTIELLDSLNVDYCAHGDDMPLNADGEDAYSKIKAAGRMRVFKRTEGISTTEIIGRLLSATKVNIPKNDGTSSYKKSSEFLAPIDSRFLTTGKRMVDFCNNRTPKPGDRVIYIDGAWDVLHMGHIDILEKAKQQGDFLYVGVHDDLTINTYRGSNYPILQLQERVFNLLALKDVDDVIIGAPWAIHKDLIMSLGITLVVCGTEGKFDEFYTGNYTEDPYKVPKEMGIFKELPSSYNFNYQVLIERLIERREHYQKKFEKKSKSEKEYYENKEYIQEL